MKLEKMERKMNPMQLFALLKSPEAKDKGVDASGTPPPPVINLTDSPTPQGSSTKRTLQTPSPSTQGKKQKKDKGPADLVDTKVVSDLEADPIDLNFQSPALGAFDDLFRTPPNDYGVRVDGLAGYLSVTATAAESQYQQIRLAIPDPLRREYQQLTPEEAYNCFVQHTYLALNSAFDTCSRHRKLLELLEVEKNGCLAAKAKLQDSDQRYSVVNAELTAANAANVELRQQITALIKERDDLSTANKELLATFEKTADERDSALAQKAAAEQNFAKLRAHLPTLSNKVLNSRSVDEKFTCYALALQLLDRVEFVEQLKSAGLIAVPLPSDIAARLCSIETAKDAVKTAQENIADIPIPKLSAVCQNEDATLDDILSLKLSAE